MLLLVAPIVVACSAVEDIKPDPLQITNQTVSVTKVTPSGIELLVELDARNPNSIHLEAESFTANVVLDGRYDMGTIDVPQEIEFPSKEQVHVGVPVVADWKDVTVIASLIALMRNVPYDVDGTVKVGRGPFKVTVRFHMSDVITEEQLRGAIGGVPLSGGIR